MCGICGIINFNNKKVTASEIKAITDTIKHRGPDAEGTFVKDNFGFGHRRLAIIDLRPKGNQPMFYEHNGYKLAITFNGEIYNFLEIKEKLLKKGYKFKTKTDTEVILASYLEWGKNCVKQFNGMWSFAIYDFNKKVVFLSRDRFGVKPLYYYRNENKFVFCSEIRGLLIDKTVPRVPNDSIISAYLYMNYYGFGKETFFKNIFRLEPGSSIIINLKTNVFSFEKYYDLIKEAKKSKFKKSDLKTLFFDAVEKRLIADVPVGSCLSGGLDSSAIVCAMRNISPKSKIKTFSLIFPGKEINEEKYQKEIIEFAKIEGHFISFDAKELLKSITDVIYTQEEPFDDFSIFGQYKVMELAKKNNMKVLLDGQGSDEILLGYRTFIGFYLVYLLKKLKPNLFLKELKNVLSIYGVMALKSILWMFPDCIVKYLLRLNGYWIKMAVPKEIMDFIKLRSNIQNELLLQETCSSLPKLLRFEDKNSMHFSIETRTPFCDYRLVEKIVNIAPEEKIKNGYQKYLFRECLNKFVPDNILWRKDKIGFAVPGNELLKDSDGQKLFKKIFFSKDFESRKYWDAKKLQKILLNHIAGKKNNRGILVKALVLELWLQKWIYVK